MKQQVIEIIDSMIKKTNDPWRQFESIHKTSVLKEVKSRIQSIQDTDEWISINDRLPDEGKTFIYLTGNGKVMVCSNRTLDDWFIRKYAVTHWVYPIPSPITK